MLRTYLVMSSLITIYVNQPPKLIKNRNCPYCGTDLEFIQKNKEHVIGRRFVPKCYLNKQWNLILQACVACNSRKSGLENDISVISMIPTFGVEGEALSKEIERKSKTKCQLTGESVANSSISETVSIPFGSAKFSFNLFGPPQVGHDRLCELAHYQLMGFFYFISYDKNRQVGGFWPGCAKLVNFCPNSDWGNNQQRWFMKATETWYTRLICCTANGYYKITFRRPKDMRQLWSWAIEWNKNYRLVGFFGKEDLIQKVAFNLPKKPKTLLTKTTKETTWMTKEFILSEEDDSLFRVLH